MIWTAVLLLLLISGPAQATIYQCRDAKGNLFLTDDVDNFPPGCKAEEVKILRKETPPPPEQKTEPPPQPAPSPTVKEQPSPVAQWRTEARQLTRSYQQAEARASPNLPPATVQKAEDRLQQLRQRIEDFRDRLAQSSLTPAEQNSVEEELAPIESAIEALPEAPAEPLPGTQTAPPPGTQTAPGTSAAPAAGR